MKQTKATIRQDKMNRLAKCFGAETGTITGKACRDNFFVAGGIEEDKADFIFNGVGHQSDGDMYRLDGNLFKKMV